MHGKRGQDPYRQTDGAKAGGARWNRAKDAVRDAFELLQSAVWNAWLAATGRGNIMKDIRYVCLSDLHLGAENSILTRLTSASNATVKLKADPAKANEV